MAAQVRKFRELPNHLRPSQRQLTTSLNAVEKNDDALKEHVEVFSTVTQVHFKGLEVALGAPCLKVGQATGITAGR